MNQIQTKSNQYFENIDKYFEKYPKAFQNFKQLKNSDPVRLDLAIEAMLQINCGKGFSIEKPLDSINVNGFYAMLDLLLLENIKRNSFYKFLKSGYIIDEFILMNEYNEIFKLYNKIETKIYNQN